MGDNVIRPSYRMVHKITAFILALLIGSPLCCCSWMHQAEPAVKSCCATKKHGTTVPKTKDKEQCPCASTPKVRDLAVSKVSVPDASLTATLPPAAIAKLPELSLQGVVVSHDCAEHGPPGLRPPLYLLHHALLM